MADITAALDASLKQVSQDLNALSQSLQKFVREQSVATESYQRQNGLLDDTSDSMEMLRDNLEKEGKLTKEEIANRVSLTKALKDQAKRVEEFNKAIKAARAAGDEGKVQQLLQNRASAVNVMNTRRGALAADKAGLSLGSLATKFNFLSVAITFLIGLIAGQYQKTKEMIEVSAGFVEGASLATAQWELNETVMKKFAIDPTELQKMLVGHRQVVHALGGTQATLEKATPAFEQFRRFGVKAEDAMRAALESTSMFMHLGIAPTTRAMESYTNDVANMGKLFGMGEVESRAYFDEIAKEADSIDLLKRARGDERAAILESQRAFIINARAAGMSAEQAKEAAKMLNKMVGAKPLDRMKQAARAQALGAAMGVGGGAEAGAAIRAGSRATTQQRAALADFSQNVATAADSMRGAGLGSELFAEAILEKLDPEGMFGRASPFSMTLADQMKIDRDEVGKKMKDLIADPVAIGMKAANDLATRVEIAMSSGMGMLSAVNGIWEILKHPLLEAIGMGPGSVASEKVKQKEQWMAETGGNLSARGKREAIAGGTLKQENVGRGFEDWLKDQPKNGAIQKAEIARSADIETKRVAVEKARADKADRAAERLEQFQRGQEQAMETANKLAREGNALTEEQRALLEKQGPSFGGARTGSRGARSTASEYKGMEGPTGGAVY